jgi:pimeloyl-ACP methyl ester carboxylesterase
MPTVASTIASASDTSARMVVSILGVWPNPATLWAMPELTSSSVVLSPHVVLIGGFLTEAAQYQPMRSRLLAQGAAAVTIAPIHLPDWAVMGLAGMGPLLLRGARAIREARRASAAPVMVVGHSMGGIIARLAMAPSPLDGRWSGVADDVGCLVTLGTPHRFTPSVPWRHPGQRAAEHLERVSPGAFFAPTTGYLTVGSSRVRPARRPPTSSAVALLNRVLGAFVGETPGVRSDGLVCSDRCRLDGVRHIEFDDVLHGLVYGPWYGDTAVIERWWPAAVEEWRAALAIRAARAGERSPGGERRSR